MFIEHGGSGPTQAAPIAIQIIREYERLAAARGPHPKPGPPPAPKITWNAGATNAPPPPQPPTNAEDAGDDATATEDGGPP